MEYKLKDLINISHGYAFKGKDFSEKPTNEIVLTPGNVNIGGGLKLDKIKYLKEDSSFDTSYIFNENDIFVTMTDLSKAGDTLGYPAFIPKANDISFLHNQRLGRIIIKDTKKIDKTYLYYLMCNQSYRNYILSTATGSTVKHTSPKTILNYKVDLPTLSKQKIIGHVLKSIDKKIENNIRIITNLEELSQTLFKRWFIDFEFPDENGNPYKASHGEMKETSVGLIPKAWEVKPLSKYIELQKGLSYKSKFLDKENEMENSFPMFTISNFHFYAGFKAAKTKYYFGDYKERHLVHEDDIIIAATDLTQDRKILGAPAIVPPLEDRMIYSLDVFRVTNSTFPVSFLYQVFQSPIYRQTVENNATGTTVIRVSNKVIENIEIPLPIENALISKFDQHTSSIYEKIKLLNQENQMLINLRDTLLPKLMSGELELPEELEV